jgi:hypothetical protein
MNLERKVNQGLKWLMHECCTGKNIKTEAAFWDSLMYLYAV